ncbi:metallophosphoesterase domain-containing protein 1 [Fusarium avenaceum]|nr:metallophosphoesterase domain-containing protein 1 [Fusarium avenaceum]
MSSSIKTRCLIISDTHGLRFREGAEPLERADVAIHCGDLTNDSKLHDFKEAIQLLKRIDAPTKIVIAGNHDFSLDDSAFKEKISEANRLAQEDLDQDIKNEYGDYGDAKRLLFEAKDHGIIFLEEGSHQVTLENGALLRLYTSPYTPSTDDSSDWGFQYNGAHDFDIEKGTDIAITHGPPHGILDMTGGRRKRVGCPQLFRAIARAQPRLHCFGHVHNSWGAKLVSWRPRISDNPSHFTDIDHEKSSVIESLSRLKGSKFESPEDKKAREDSIERYNSQRCCISSHCGQDEKPLRPGETLFVNAAVMGDDGLSQLPWLIDIELEGKEQDRKRKADPILTPKQEVKRSKPI